MVHQFFQSRSSQEWRRKTAAPATDAAADGHGDYETTTTTMVIMMVADIF